MDLERRLGAAVTALDVLSPSGTAGGGVLIDGSQSRRREDPCVASGSLSAIVARLHQCVEKKRLLDEGV